MNSLLCSFSRRKGTINQHELQTGKLLTCFPPSFPSELLLVATFNILHGFPEALVRGMRSSFMKDADYHHLTQCESLDDCKLNLTETDYSDALADITSMTPATLQKVAIEKVCVCSFCSSFGFICFLHLHGYIYFLNFIRGSLD